MSESRPIGYHKTVINGRLSNAVAATGRVEDWSGLGMRIEARLGNRVDVTVRLALDVVAEPLPGVEEIALVHNVVAIEDAARGVAQEGHGDALRHTAAALD